MRELHPIELAVYYEDLAKMFTFARRDDIFINIVPDLSWSLKYRFTIDEALYDKFEYQGWGCDYSKIVSDEFDEYEDALHSAVEYVEANARQLEDGRLTFLK